MHVEGRIHKFGDHVDTDVILPGRYLALNDPQALAGHCLEGLDPDFAARVSPGDIILAGRNFGSGSSREHAPIAIKAVGVGCVVAASFARIFYRNAINIGLPIITCPAFAAAGRNGGRARIDLAAGTITSEGETFSGEPLPEIIREIVAAGGLVEHVRQRLAARAAILPSSPRQP